MNISLKWLKDFVDIENVDIKNYCDKMTMSGSKVEMFKEQSSDYKNVVTGKVIEIKSHPDADKLIVCKIDLGDSRDNVQIVTGATNLNVGDIVPVALHKSLLPNNVKITKGKLRGVISDGMMCSVSELNISINDIENAIEDGILILPANTNLGEDITKTLNLDDTLIEFEITSNRPDCLGIIGLARETSATFNTPIVIEKPTIKNQTDNINNYINVDVKSNLCKRYMAKMATNVKIGPSPIWLRRRLELCGIKSINNIVDITNYVMLEYGQPMHAFDYETLTTKHIVVDFASENDKFKTLDEHEHTLNSNVLCIKDTHNNIALAGIMGGENSQITEKTKTIVLEIACFDGYNIRNTSKSLNIRTDSSSKFEKGLDPKNCEHALLRASQLIEHLCCGDIIGEHIDVFNEVPTLKEVELDYNHINKFLGTNIPNNEILSILKSLSFIVNDNKITIPSFRQDIIEKSDIVEEVARIYGYDKIPLTLPSANVICKKTKEQIFEEKLNETLLSCSLNEIITFSFISPNDYDKINLSLDDVLRESVEISNPLGEATSIMRTTSLPSMLSTLSFNYNNRNLNVSLYEISKEYRKSKNILPDEIKKIIAGVYGENKDFYYIKGICEAIFHTFNIKNYRFTPFRENTSYHSGRCANIFINNEHVGVLGEIHPKVLNNYNIKTRCYTLELDFNSVFKNTKDSYTYKALPKFPAVSRDLALICDKNVLVSDIKDIILKSSKDILENVKLFDVFESEQIGENNKSVAFNLTLRSYEHTLVDSEIDSTIQNILNNLKNINVVLRT
ncbi:MAG: phenylalanine--tRNA ligase subunit beta [Oscillospiraceae bacterium]